MEIFASAIPLNFKEPKSSAVCGAAPLPLHVLGTGWLLLEVTRLPERGLHCSEFSSLGRADSVTQQLHGMGNISTAVCRVIQNFESGVCMVIIHLYGFLRKQFLQQFVQQWGQPDTVFTRSWIIQDGIRGKWCKYWKTNQNFVISSGFAIWDDSDKKYFCRSDVIP